MRVSASAPSHRLMTSSIGRPDLYSHRRTRRSMSDIPGRTPTHHCNHCTHCTNAPRRIKIDPAADGLILDSPPALPIVPCVTGLIRDHTHHLSGHSDSAIHPPAFLLSSAATRGPGDPAHPLPRASTHNPGSRWICRQIIRVLSYFIWHRRWRG